MKLSFKFFCISYIIVLLSSGIGGIILIEYITNILWNTQQDRVNTSVSYATQSVVSLSQTSYGQINDTNKNIIINQVKSLLDSSIKTMQIDIISDKSDEYKSLKNYENKISYMVDENKVIMKNQIRINIQNEDYIITLKSDFSDIQKQCDLIWNIYTIVILLISILSGIILFILSKKITKPINKLSKMADEISLGNYGKTINIKSDDYEIINLSNSLNSMSKMIEQKINDVKEEVNKRDMFVADFTHELKTPMTAIIGYSQMLNDYDLELKERQDATKTIYNEAKRLEKLSMQLLNLYIYKKDDIEFSNVSLKVLENNLNETLKLLSNKYGVKYKINFENEVVYINKELIISLIYNLVDNAFKASTQKDDVIICSKTFADYVKILIKDKGIGIDSKNIKLITEPFFREDKARSRKLGGAGLGLSLCNEITKLHNCKLQIDSQKQKGTTVSFNLKKVGEKNATW